MNYPIYRRNITTRVFHKIISENEIVTVRVTNNETKIYHSRSAYRIAEALQEDKSRPVTKDEFLQVYTKGEARLSIAIEA